MSLRFEVIDSADGKEWEITLKDPPRAIELAKLAQIDCKFAPGNTNRPAFMSREWNVNSKLNREEFKWAFPKSAWTDIEITFIDYDQIAEFHAVSVSPGARTSPQVIEPRSTKE
jgi:hypothetical protein